ncbi:hypothetical protein MTBBW1_1980006 [Desulfamplus magnetovallimortis]|uniref:Uncharacterized protein n=1 Tax=Desulfamplus magnetovallimortis TaxID=1246637 RepID=A0A1W1HBB0_9BACT|nr:hypothetical protein MTBBW1_1980006 [Desulfamplus magnetovallimortis]
MNRRVSGRSTVRITEDNFIFTRFHMDIKKTQLSSNSAGNHKLIQILKGGLS